MTRNIALFPAIIKKKAASKPNFQVNLHNKIERERVKDREADGQTETDTDTGRLKNKMIAHFHRELFFNYGQIGKMFVHF